MKIKGELPLQLTVYYQESPAKVLDFSFWLGRNKVATRAVGKLSRINRRKYRLLPPYLFNCEKIIIEIEIPYSRLTRKELLKIANLLLAAHSKIIDMLRSYASVTYIKRQYLNKKYYLSQLEEWNFSLSTVKNKVYKKISLVKNKSFDYLVRRFGDKVHYSNADGKVLELVQESLAENYQFDEAKELNLRAREFLNDGEFRNALLESVFCLELLTSRFIEMHLETSNPEIGSDAIGNLTGPNGESLRGKVGVLLRVWMHKSWLKNIDIEKVLKVIHSRNKIAHKGVIKLNLSDPKDYIQQVVLLNDALLKVMVQLEYSPQKQEIVSEFNKKFDTYPVVWIYKNHVVYCVVTIYSDTKSNPISMKAMADTISETRKMHDRFFDPKKHLVVEYKEFIGDKIIGRWSNNKLKRYS